MNFMRLATSVAILLMTINLKADKIDTSGLPITVEIDTTLCDGITFEDPNGTFNQAGMYVDTFALGACDSIRILNLSYFDPPMQIITQACASDFPGPSAPSEYISVIQDENGCDQLNIQTVLPVTPDNVTDVEICPGELFIWMDQFITETGSYQEILFDANGCEFTEILRVFEKPAAECLVSTEADLISTHLKLYPNPAQSYILVSGLESSQKSHRVELISSTGQAISTTTTSASELRLDISTLPAGLYTAKISAEGARGVKTVSFVKE